MIDQKVEITNDAKIINDLIAQGWRVNSVTPQQVAISHGSANIGLNDKPAIRGYFCFVMEKLT